MCLGVMYDVAVFCFCYLMIRRPPRATRTDTLFPYTTLVRSDELFAQMFTLRAAALQSTASALGGILLTMCRHPDQFALVKAEPALVPSAVEECLRVHGSGYLSFPRFALRDTELGGTFIRSEEHTSELQSLMRTSYAVFCLKKKKNNYCTTNA